MEARFKEIGERIKTLRKDKELTLKQLGALIGRTESLVSQYEKGKVEIPYSIMVKLADVLGTDEHTLRTGKTGYQGTLNLEDATPENVERLANLVKSLPDRVMRFSNYWTKAHGIFKSYNITMEDFFSLSEEHEALLDKYALTPAQFSEMINALNALDEEAIAEREAEPQKKRSIRVR